MTHDRKIPKLLTEDEVCQVIRAKKTTFRTQRSRRIIELPPVYLGRSRAPLFWEDDVIALIKKSIEKSRVAFGGL